MNRDAARNTRFRRHPATFGYDILNEPSVEPETWRQLCRINGVWWDKEQIRVALKPWIEFQMAHPDAPILVGEFSCILWSKGADKWIRSGTDTARKRELLKGLSHNR